jgi:hypothetical protein
MHDGRKHQRNAQRKSHLHVSTLEGRTANRPVHIVTKELALGQGAYAYEVDRFQKTMNAPLYTRIARSLHSFLMRTIYCHQNKASR